MQSDGTRYSEAECLSALQQAADTLGETPTMDEYQTLGISPSATTISERCGNWRLAVSKAGLDPVSREQYTKDECIRALQNFAETYGSEPTISTYKKSGYSPSHSVIADRLGSWSEAKEVAGVTDADEELSPAEEADQFFDMLEDAEPAYKQDG